MPLIEEVAADIFTGTFTTKWAEAAAVASRSLDGTLYARYYDLPGPQGRARRARRHRHRAVGKDDSGGLHRAMQIPRRRGPGQRRVRQPGRGERDHPGAGQILTTHNLALLTDTLGLRDRVAGLAPELADRAFAWLVRRLRKRPANLAGPAAGGQERGLRLAAGHLLPQPVPAARPGRGAGPAARPGAGRR